MSHWIRIIIVALLSIGSAGIFGYWSIRQFNITLNSIGDSYSTNIASLSATSLKSLDSKSEDETKNNDEIILEYYTVSTSSTTDLATSSIYFNFPKKESVLVENCEYKISWQLYPQSSSSSTFSSTSRLVSSTTKSEISTDLSNLKTFLIDAESKKYINSDLSNLPTVHSTSTLDKNSFTWKVGSIPEGEYFILVPRLSDKEMDGKSSIFTIKEMNGVKDGDQSCI